jgi:predicted transcriptional regulator of viral defense system
MSNIAQKLLELTSSGKTVFITADLAIIWGAENKNILRVTIARAIEKGYLESIRRSVYKLKDKEIDIFELAGKLKKNSYVSFETVLAQSGIIFQWHNEIVSASNRNSVVKNRYGKFLYRELPEDVLLNNKGLINKGNYFIASAERALCDKVYKDGISYFDSLNEIDAEKAIEISQNYRNKRLERDIKKLFYENKQRRA